MVGNLDFLTFCIPSHTHSLLCCIFGEALSSLSVILGPPRLPLLQMGRYCLLFVSFISFCIISDACTRIFLILCCLLLYVTNKNIGIFSSGHSIRHLFLPYCVRTFAGSERPHCCTPGHSICLVSMAWSSARQPEKLSMLLQSSQQAFVIVADLHADAGGGGSFSSSRRALLITAVFRESWKAWGVHYLRGQGILHHHLPYLTRLSCLGDGSVTGSVTRCTLHLPRCHA